MGISPLVSSTLSDTFLIRRVLYIGFTLIFALASLGGGYANSAGSLIVARVFQAVGSGGASILGAGTVADIYVSTSLYRLLGNVLVLYTLYSCVSSGHYCHEAECFGRVGHKKRCMHSSHHSFLHFSIRPIGYILLF